MDPRHPELAISRMRELMKQYDRIEADMNKASTSANLAELEREGSLVVQEICLVAPRLHEAMMQTSRQRRHDLSRGILIEPQDTAVELSVHKWSSAEKVVEAKEYLEQTMANSDVEKTAGKSEPTEEKEFAPKKEATAKKKTIRKKKTTKKAE